MGKNIVLNELFNPPTTEFDYWMLLVNSICSFTYECGKEAFNDGLFLDQGVILGYADVEPQALLSWEKGWMDAYNEMNEMAVS